MTLVARNLTNDITRWNSVYLIRPTGLTTNMIRNFVIRTEGRRSILMRSNSSRPSFNPTSSFQHVNPPTPNWQLGGGTPRVSEWDIENTRRKTWDFSKQESFRYVVLGHSNTAKETLFSVFFDFQTGTRIGF